MTAMVVLLYRLTTCNMSDAPPDRTGSREQRALRKSAAIFRAAVDPSSIISALHDEQLLTSQEWNKARHQMLTTDERVDVVWEALMRRAAVDPSVFHLVVKILRNVPAMKKLGDQMQSMSRKGFSVDHFLISGVLLYYGHSIYIICVL